MYNRADNYIGLSSDPYLFTRKRAFLGYVDSEILIDEQTGLLNDKSAFYTEANTALSTVSFNGFGNAVDNAFDLSENAADLAGNSENYENLREPVKDRIVYSIPIDEATESVGCLGELFQNDTGLNFIGSNEGLSINDSDVERKSYIARGVFSHYQDSLYKKLLSLKKPENGTYRLMKLSEADAYATEVKKKHRVMFDLLFPVDRYAANHFVQNIEIMNSGKETQSILFGTKIMLWSIMDQTINYRDMEVSTTDLVANAGGPDAPKLNISNITYLSWCHSNFFKQTI